MGTKSFPLTYKIVAYVVAWLAALFATNPNGKYWPLVYLFPLGLPAFFSRYWANTGGWAVLASSVAAYLLHGWFYFRSRKIRLDAVPFRDPNRSAALQCFGMQGNAAHALKRQCCSLITFPSLADLSKS
jgi:hypothetical protein